MSTSEAITRADLANILNEVLPPMWGMVTKVKTLTGTTDANGNLALGFSASDVSEVICVIGNSGSYFVYVPFVYNGNWYAKVMSSDTSHTSIRNTSVSVTISYLVASSASVADYIVDQGTSGIWTYRKWNSGIAECWGTYSWTITSWAGWGNIFESNSSYATYPSSLFIATPMVNIGNLPTSAGDATVSVEVNQTLASATRTPTMYLTRGTQGSTNVTGYVSIIAKGRWK